MTPNRNSYDTKFFPEPTKFTPERWLQDEETVAAMNHVFMPFAAGSRGCLGMQYVVLTPLFFHLIGRLTPMIAIVSQKQNSTLALRKCLDSSTSSCTTRFGRGILITFGRISQGSLTKGGKDCDSK